MLEFFGKIFRTERQKLRTEDHSSVEWKVNDFKDRQRSLSWRFNLIGFDKYFLKLYTGVTGQELLQLRQKIDLESQFDNETNLFRLCSEKTRHQILHHIQSHQTQQ